MSDAIINITDNLTDKLLKFKEKYPPSLIHESNKSRKSGNTSDLNKRMNNDLQYILMSDPYMKQHIEGYNESKRRKSKE